MTEARAIELFLDWCAKQDIRLTQGDPEQRGKRVLVPRGELMERYRLDGGFGR